MNQTDAVGADVVVVVVVVFVGVVCFSLVSRCVLRCAAAVGVVGVAVVVFLSPPGRPTIDRRGFLDQDASTREKEPADNLRPISRKR